jgi:hypothetical protein
VVLLPGERNSYFCPSSFLQISLKYQILTGTNEIQVLSRVRPVCVYSVVRLQASQRTEVIFLDNNSLFSHIFYLSRRRDVSVDSVVRLRDRLQEVRSLIPCRGSYFSSYQHSFCFGALSDTYPVDTWGLHPKLKCSGFEAYHTPPSNAEFMNTWRYNAILPTLLRGVVFN